MAMIRDNILRLNDDISLICQRLGRKSEEVTVVAVTKYAVMENIQEALSSGLSHVGENKVQEALKKFSSLRNSFKCTRHMIGHLQTNKVRDALKIFDCIQSVDSLKLAEAIEKEAERLNKKIDILIQVNTSSETQKYGISENQASSLIDKLAGFKYLRVLGLMTVGPLAEEAIIRDCFQKLKLLYGKIAKEFSGQNNIPMKLLSMGMSSDYRIALEEGSNMVRIGSAIFKHV